MPNATLTFDLPREETEFRAALDGMKWRCAFIDLVETIQRVSVGDSFVEPDPKLQQIRETLRTAVEERGLVLP